MAATTQWVEVALYLAVNPHAVAWVVLSAGTHKFMLLRPKLSGST